jgi:CDP-diacylglycerol---serine O-phosphatidyltransferase
MAMKKEETIKSDKNSDLFIVKLNWLDLITLSGIMIALISVLYSHFSSLEYALAYLFVAMLVDNLNSVIASTLKMKRLFGRYMDGFVNLLVYLIAPAVFFYYFGFERLHLVWILLLFGASGIVRLSVYDQIGDIEVEKRRIAYLGMPVNWSHFIAAAFYGLTYIFNKDAVVYTAAATIIIYSFLMVLNKPFVSIEKKPYMFFIIIALIVFFFWLGISKNIVMF